MFVPTGPAVIDDLLQIPHEKSPAVKMFDEQVKSRLGVKIRKWLCN